MRPTGARSPGPGGLDSERTRPAGEIEHRRADQQEDEAPPEVHIDSQDARALDRARGDQDHAVKRELQSERQPKVSPDFTFSTLSRGSSPAPSGVVAYAAGHCCGVVARF